VELGVAQLAAGECDDGYEGGVKGRVRGFTLGGLDLAGGYYLGVAELGGQDGGEDPGVCASSRRWAG